MTGIEKDCIFVLAYKLTNKKYHLPHHHPLNYLCYFVRVGQLTLERQFVDGVP